MSYAIPDEPRPGGLAQYVVRPGAPLLAAMVAGAWLAWPWFVFNSYALGSPTRRREIALCAAGLGGTVALAALLLLLVDRGVIVGDTPFRLGMLAIAGWKLGCAYAVRVVQDRTFHVYEHHRGLIRDARRILIAGAMARGLVIGLFAHDLWAIIVAGGA